MENQMLHVALKAGFVVGFEVVTGMSCTMENKFNLHLISTRLVFSILKFTTNLWLKTAQSYFNLHTHVCTWLIQGHYSQTTQGCQTRTFFSGYGCHKMTLADWLACGDRRSLIGWRAFALWQQFVDWLYQRPRKHKPDSPTREGFIIIVVHCGLTRRGAYLPGRGSQHFLIFQ